MLTQLDGCRAAIATESCITVVYVCIVPSTFVWLGAKLNHIREAAAAAEQENQPKIAYVHIS